METNLLATFEASVVPALTGAASELADAREEKLRDGVALSLPLLLGAIVRKCTAAGGPGDVHRMLTAESIDAGMLDSIDTPLADDGRALATSSLGANLLSSLFGAATDSVNRQVAQRAGLELDEARRLLALLTALMFVFLKRWIEQHDLDAAALTAQLLEQRPVPSSSNTACIAWIDSTALFGGVSRPSRKACM